jgi:glycosyltransferase involved in cell wall biosynthesis
MAIDLSVILPVLNEGENLCVLLPRMRALLERKRLAYEIIVVDGGSTEIRSSI